MSKIYVVGIGPGEMEYMTPKAIEAIENSDLVIGYKTYIELVRAFFKHKEFISSGMTKEVERCKLVLEKALSGKTVALISSGDSGIYGMAGIMLEVVNSSKVDIEVEIVPGITAANAAASVLGAPLMHDFVIISLSDLMTPWEIIRNRIECAAKGDFVICLYNPKSKGRTEYIKMTKEIVSKHRNSKTPVGIVKNARRENESSVITILEEMLNYDIDMFTVVIIGNSTTYIENNRMITPRGYLIEGIKDE